MFGGAMISLILPKLIRSVARDGILISSFWPSGGIPPLLYSPRPPPKAHLCLTTQGKPAAFNGQLAKPAIYSSTKLKIVNFCPAFSP
jgi:hypothetical protein